MVALDLPRHILEKTYRLECMYRHLSPWLYNVYGTYNTEKYLYILSRMSMLFSHLYTKAERLTNERISIIYLLYLFKYIVYKYFAVAILNLLSTLGLELE